jgi:hypothetical protein
MVRHTSGRSRFACEDGGVCLACDAPLRQCLEWHIKPCLDGPEFYKGDPTKGFDDGYSARCPAHDDGHRSFTVNVGKHRIWYQCHAGCDQLAVRAELIAKGVPDQCLPISKQRQEDLIAQLNRLLTTAGMEDGHKVLLALAHVRGMSELPRGKKLEALAADTGTISNASAYRHRRAGTRGQDPTSGRYSSRQAEIKNQRSPRRFPVTENSHDASSSHGDSSKTLTVRATGEPSDRNRTIDSRIEKTGDEAA